MSKDKRQLALDYLECVRRLDTAGMQDCFADGAKIWLPGQGWMEPSGLAALLDGGRDKLVDGICFTHDGVLEAGNRVVVMTACDSPLVGGGSYINQFCFIFTFDASGKIGEMREYTDTGPAISAFHS